MSSNPSCCKNIWVLLSGTTTLKSREFVEKSLNDHSDRIVKGILFYSKNNSSRHTSNTTFSNGIPQSIIQKLSSILNIDSGQASDLIVTYLLNDFTGNLKGISAQFSGEKSIQAFIEDVISFYSIERLFSLLVLKEILSNFHSDSRHPFHEVFSEFVARTFSHSSSLPDSIISQLNGLNDFSNIESHELSGDIRRTLADSAIRERFELDQLLILAFHHFPPSMSTVLQLFSAFNRNSSGMFVSRNENVDFHLQEVASYTGLLESIILVQCLSVNKLSDTIEIDSIDHQLLSSPAKLQEIDRMIRDSSFSVRSNSVLFLGWIIVRSWELDGLSSEESAQVIKTLGSLTMEMDVFDVLDTFFSSNLFERIFSETMVGRSLKEIIGHLLSVTFKIYRMEQLIGNKKSSLLRLVKVIETSDEVARITFDESCSESGLVVILKDCLVSFPSKISPFIEIATSITSTPSSRQLFELMSEIKTFSETLSTCSTVIELAGNDRFYRSTIDRTAASGNIYIRRGQIGEATKYSSIDSSVTILWSDVSANGWTILSNVYKKYHDTLSVGGLQVIDDESVHDLVLINNLCSSIVSSGSKITLEIREILKYSVESFKLLAKHPKIPRKYISSVLELFSTLSVYDAKKKDAVNFWVMINEFALFPYSISTFANEPVAHGQDLNPSTIGSLICGVDCIRGEYELTCSFLNYISTAIDSIQVDDVLSSCVIFILSEIFPQYHLWHFKNSKEQSVIGYHCLTIAYKALKMSKSPSHKLSKIALEILTRGKPSETLLHIIRTGIITAGAVINNIGVHEALNGEEVVTVRLSLLVLEQILTLSKKGSDISGTDQTVSNIENSIFSSRGSVVKSLHDKTAVASQNILLVLAHYVFQTFDSSLASQAAIVMKVLASRHPLSMMSCLGTESESVKEHFLAKLDSPTEDIDVKVSILEFLAECVINQPGLTEVFVSHENGSGTSSNTNTVLDTVLGILEEKKEGIVFCPPELHSTALRFLSNFWVNASLPTIECLKKNPKLWTLITFPLLEPNENAIEEDFHPKIISCIQKVIAREIFFRKRLDQSPPDPGFNRVLTLLPSRVTHLSRFLKEFATSEVIRDDNEDSLVIFGWKDLLISVALFNPIELTSETKVEVVINLLESILKQLQLNGSQNVITSLSDTCLIIVKHWSTSLLQSHEEWANLNSSITYVLNESKDSLNFGLLTSLQSYLARCISIISSDVLVSRVVNLADLVPPVTDLLLHSLRILEKVIVEDGSSKTVDSNLSLTSLSLFNSLIISASSHSSLWIPAVKSSDLLSPLSLLLQHLLSNKLRIDLCQSIISTLISFSNDPLTAELLVSTTNLSWMRTALKCDYTDLPPSSSLHQSNRWNSIYCLTLRLATTLMINLKQFFVNESLVFVTENLDRITNCLRNLRSCPSLELLNESKEVLMFLRVLSKFKMFWITNHPVSYQIIADQVSTTSNSITSFLVHPNLFAHLMENPPKTQTLFKAKISVMKEQQPNLDRSFASPNTKKGPFEQQPQTKLKPAIEKLLFHILASTIQFMVQVTPSIEELVAIRKDPSKAKGLKLTLDRSFVDPNIDSESGMSFGSLLSAFDTCSAFIRKGEEESRPDAEYKQTKEQMEVLMEMSLNLMVSQSIVSQVDSTISLRDQQLISRELQSRLSSLRRRASSSKRSSTSSRNPASAFVPQNQTIKHLIHLLDETCPMSEG